MAEKSMAPAYRQAINESARLLQQNRPGEALDALKPFFDRLPDDVDLAINVGGAYILQRKWAKAVTVLQAAARVNQDNVMIWTNLAAAQLGPLEVSGPRQQERAIDAYQRALQIDPLAANVHYALGLIYRERGELLRASTFFQRALEVNPSDRDAKTWLHRIDALLAATRQAPPSDETPASSTDSPA